MEMKQKEVPDAGGRDVIRKDFTGEMTSELIQWSSAGAKGWRRNLCAEEQGIGKHGVLTDL